MTSRAKRLSQLLLALALTATSCSTTSATESPANEPIQPEPTHPEAGAPGTGPDSIQPPGAPTVAPEFPYSGQGETLALVQYVDEGSHRILFLDPFGLGFREFRLPEDVQIHWSMVSGLSPNGAYYTFYSGSTETADLTLVIYDLNAATIAIEIPLLSSDYPNNFQELADTFIASDNIPEDLSWVEPENFARELQSAFEYGIETFAWSPDGRYLAFSGQMEGPSSDLYVLDLQTMQTTRLTSGTGMMERMSWSPDGYWIRHTSIYFVGAGYDVTNHAASLDGTQVISFPAHLGLEWGPWLTNDLYLANDGANGPGSFNLMVMDTRSGSATTLFYGAFMGYVYDPDANAILLQNYPFFDTDPEQGLYLIEASEPYDLMLLSTPGIYSLSYVGLDGYPYMVLLEDAGTVLIRSDGSQMSISDRHLQSVPAPTANLLALSNQRSNQDNPELWIYDPDTGQRTNVYSGAVSWVEWRPDSGAIFYISGHELHVYTLDTGEHMLIYAWPGSPVSNSYLTWINLP